MAFRCQSRDLPFPFPTRRVHILLSIQYALLGEIDTNVRCINIEWTDETITVYFFFDKEITESNVQSMQNVKDEISQDFPKDAIHIQEIQCDYPKRVLGPEKSIAVYSRKEDYFAEQS